MTPAAANKTAKGLPTGYVVAPEVIGIEGEHLIYRPDLKRHRLQPGSFLITDFCALADAPPDEIFGFARRWGALGVDVHGWHNEAPHEDAMVRYQKLAFSPDGPRAMKAFQESMDRENALTLLSASDVETGHIEPDPQRAGWTTRAKKEHVRRLIEEDAKCGETWREPIAGWRAMARRLRSALRLAHALKENTPVSEGDLQVLCGHRHPSGELPVRGNRSVVRLELEQFMRTMILNFGLTPTLRWNWAARRFEPGIDATYGLAGLLPGMSNLPGVLVLQAMAVVAGRPILICAHCIQLYAPERLPTRGESHYCRRKECQEAAAANAKREQRRKARERTAR